jgi:type I pantothenate kinase
VCELVNAESSPCRQQVVQAVWLACPSVPIDPALAAIATRLDPVPGTAGVLTVAGAVAVGKSTIAAALAEELRARGRRVEVVSTDGFLHPNAVLLERGLLDRKGFPETYDLDRLDRLLDAARDGRTPLEVPVYSHEQYDVVAEPQQIDRPDVLVVEGIVALQRRFGDLAVFIDADPDDIERWYVARFQDLVAAAADDPTSFYRGWIDLEPDEVADLARAVWGAVNGPNLIENIDPTRARADVIVHKGPDHRILSVEWTDP